MDGADAIAVFEHETQDVHSPAVTYRMLESCRPNKR
jgi:hypothetical protein